MWMDARSPKLQTGRSMCPQGPHIELSPVWGMEAREWGAKPWISFEGVTRNINVMGGGRDVGRVTWGALRLSCSENAIPNSL